MKVSFYLSISILIFKLNLFSQIDIPIVSENTLNIKLKYIGKVSTIKLIWYNDLFSSLPIYKPKHFNVNEVNYPKKSKENFEEIALAKISNQNKDTINKEYIYLLVVNYKSNNPIIYINKNGTFNFSVNDKIIDKNTKVARIKVETKKGALEYIIDLNKKKKPYHKDVQFNDTTNLIDEKYYIPIWQNKIKYGVIKNETDSFNIALFDVNNNGAFNEKGIDLMMVNSKIESNYFIPITNSSAKKISTENVVKLRDNIFYEITHIDPLGDYLLIEKLNKNSTKNYIKIFDKIPDESFINADSVLLHLKSFCNKGKYTYINILTEFCRPCIKKIPAIDSLSIKYSDKITIISLLDRGNYQDLKNLIKQFNIHSLYGLSNQKINYEINANGYPYGVLFDKEGNVIKEIRFDDELEDFLRTHE